MGNFIFLTLPKFGGDKVSNKTSQVFFFSPLRTKIKSKYKVNLPSQLFGITCFILWRNTRISIEIHMGLMERLQNRFLGKMISVSIDTWTGKIIIINNCEKNIWEQIYNWRRAWEPPNDILRETVGFSSVESIKKRVLSPSNYGFISVLPEDTCTWNPSWPCKSGFYGPDETVCIRITSPGKETLKGTRIKY